MQGQARQEPGAGLCALQLAKSNLLLEAQLLRTRRLTDEAAVKFAQAAEIEERLSDACLGTGRRTDAWRHRYSALG
jgi:hypothetical protein